MRFLGMALVSSAVVLGACGGEKKEEATTTTTTTPAATAAAPAAGAAGATSTTPAAPITGKTHEVKMVGDASGYKFVPAEITVKAGDGIKFTFVSGGPHNVAADPAVVPADIKGQLDANIPGPNKMGELSSAMMLNAGESVTVSFGSIKAGVYTFHCTPHQAMNMNIKVTVQ